MSSQPRPWQFWLARNAFNVGCLGYLLVLPAILIANWLGAPSVGDFFRTWVPHFVCLWALLFLVAANPLISRMHLKPGSLTSPVVAWLLWMLAFVGPVFLSLATYQLRLETNLWPSLFGPYAHNDNANRAFVIAMVGWIFYAVYYSLIKPGYFSKTKAGDRSVAATGSAERTGEVGNAS